jgi:type II secretory pathway component GspD/PulD (secretin)
LIHEEAVVKRLIGSCIGVTAVILAYAAGGKAQSVPSSAAATMVAVTTSAPAPAASRPTVADLLTHKTATLEFHDATISAMMDSISKTYDIDIFNTYDLKGLVTMKSEDTSARQAINSLNSTILALGYTLVESVRGDPPRIVLTVVPTRSDAGALMPVFYGSNPDLIPEGTDMRTQIMTFTGLDPDKVKTLLSAVIGRQAQLDVNSGARTITLTDTGSHVHAAAALLQALEKQAEEQHP